MQHTILILIMALFSLLTGLSLYFWLNAHFNARYFYTTMLISWLLIALFPVMLIFSFFPQSSASGNIFGFSLAGAIAAFFVIWWYGTRSALAAQKIDVLEDKIRGLEEKQRDISHERRTPIVLQHCETFIYKLKHKRSKRIVLITGGIELVKVADIWVSSENTNMEMSRFYENSVSGVIRYYGAKKDQAGNVIDDTIARELSGAMGKDLYVQPGTVIITNAGDLQQTHNVKKLFHVAAVQGEVGTGYQPIRNIQLCVTKALQKADTEELRSLALKSILFPLLGTGTAKGDVKETARKLIEAAISYLETSEKSTIECVYFLMWTNVELEVCRGIVEEVERLAK